MPKRRTAQDLRKYGHPYPEDIVIDSPHKVTVFDGGVQILSTISQGLVMNSQAGFVYFIDRATQKYMEITGGCVIVEEMSL